MENFEEQELVKLLLSGDEKAYRHVVKTYHNSMLFVARSIVGTAIAEEVVQEAWLSVIKALPGFEGRSSLKTWVLRIVSNSAKSRLRKESRHFSAGDAQDMEALNIPDERFVKNGHWSTPPVQWNISSPEALIAEEELNLVIRQTMSRLPEIQQAIISLRDMEGLSMEEICKILEISESNSRVLLHRARTRIWQAIEKYQGKSLC